MLLRLAIPLTLVATAAYAMQPLPDTIPLSKNVIIAPPEPWRPQPAWFAFPSAAVPRDAAPNPTSNYPLAPWESLQTKSDGFRWFTSIKNTWPEAKRRIERARTGN